MSHAVPGIVNRILILSFIFFVLLIFAMIFGVSIGSSDAGLSALWHTIFSKASTDTVLPTIIWEIRFPRVLVAALVGATLSLGGLVFQALLKNPLAEPYILGISGGSAIGAIIGILIGLSRFPGVTLTAFTGSLTTLVLILVMASGKTMMMKDALLLSGVMVNAFCTAVIMFLISLTQDSRLHNIMFWLMGDLSASDFSQAGILFALLLPCFIVIFRYSNTMNLLLMGNDLAVTMGINVRRVSLILLIVTTFMVSATVSNCGLIAFVGLVIPHLIRLMFGSDHRLLVPVCILAGSAYMVICDLLARSLPAHGEMPVGVITAMIGAPLFIILLKRAKT